MGIPTTPIRQTHSKSFLLVERLLELLPAVFLSATAKGASISPPSKNRKKVSCTLSTLPPPVLSATSIVPNKSAAIHMQIITFFTPFTFSLHSIPFFKFHQYIKKYRQFRRHFNLFSLYNCQSIPVSAPPVFPCLRNRWLSPIMNLLNQ